MSTYDDAFLSIMQYVDMRLNMRGVRVHIETKSDIERLIKALDEDRTARKERPKITPQFLKELLATNEADKTIGTTIGRRGPTHHYNKERTHDSTNDDGTPREIKRNYEEEEGE